MWRGKGDFTVLRCLKRLAQAVSGGRLSRGCGDIFLHAKNITIAHFDQKTGTVVQFQRRITDKNLQP